jgi:hypothetical protein
MEEKWSFWRLMEVIMEKRVKIALLGLSLALYQTCLATITSVEELYDPVTGKRLLLANDVHLELLPTELPETLQQQSLLYGQIEW